MICNIYYDRSWKSKKHSDGTMYDGMFIVGINTPEGQATYHYDIDPYWDMFDVPELEFSPEWDGHTSDDAIERITSLKTAMDNLSVIKRMTKGKLAEFIEKVEDFKTDLCCSDIKCDTYDEQTHHCEGNCVNVIKKWLDLNSGGEKRK